MIHLLLMMAALAGGETELTHDLPPVPAVEYTALALERSDVYVKDTRHCRIDMVEGANAPGVKVGGDRRLGWSHVHYVKGRAWITFTFDYPPDTLRQGQPVKIPLRMKIRRDDEAPIDVTASVVVHGVKSPARVIVHPARIVREDELGPIRTTDGDAVIIPRLDWDDARISIDYVLKDAGDTRWVVGRFVYRSTLDGH